MILAKATDFIRGDAYVDGITGTLKPAHAAGLSGIEELIYETYPMTPVRGFSQSRLEMIDHIWDQRPVYFTEHVPEVFRRYRIKRLGNSYRIIGRR